MNTAPTLAAFGLAVAAMFGVGAAVGAAVGPLDVGGDPHTSDEGARAPDDGAGATGLSIAAGGFRLVVDSVALTEARPSEFGFRILDERGEAFTDFDLLHDRRLHLILVSRNLIDYVHVHPEMSADGHWSVGLTALAAGSYRVFADFQAAGSSQITLGADVLVPGALETVALPTPSTVTRANGYAISVEGTSVSGESTLAFTVSRGGDVVKTDPYLGAAGHLVAIRSGDLAYLHVHPVDGDDTAISFVADYPSAGTYRLFLDFSHGGEVHTASFTVIVADGGPSTAAPTTEAENEGH